MSDFCSYKECQLPSYKKKKLIALMDFSSDWDNINLITLDEDN